MRHYLVDSENVNDNWLMLLEFTEMTDDIIVFYTDKSPHMSYTSLVRIVEQTHQIQFKKCYTGPNGLDFQLVSYLGYLMCDNQDSDDEFIIMSNDNGFDCVVKFWNNRNITVKRLDVAHCKQLYDQFLFRKQQDRTDLEQNESISNELEQVKSEPINLELNNSNTSTQIPVESSTHGSKDPECACFGELGLNKASRSRIYTDAGAIKQVNGFEPNLSLSIPITSVPVQSVPSEKKSTESVTAEIKTVNQKLIVRKTDSSNNKYDFNKEQVDTFINCLGRNNLTAIHETLMRVYGQPHASQIYKVIKSKTYPLNVKTYKRKDKMKRFADIIFENAEVENPGDFVEFLDRNKDKTKNLNSMRAAVIKEYGNERGMKYYTLFKPHFKVISAFKD